MRKWSRKINNSDLIIRLICFILAVFCQVVICKIAHFSSLWESVNLPSKKLVKWAFTPSIRQLDLGLASSIGTIVLFVKAQIACSVKEISPSL